MNALASDAVQADAKQILTSALIEEARLHASESEESILTSLQKLTGWNAEVLMAQVGDLFSYPTLSMRALQALKPQFEYISFSDCAQKGVLAGFSHDGSLLIVLSDPFDGTTEEWAIRRCVANGASRPSIAVTHPADFQAYLAQQESNLRAMDGFDSQGSVGGDEEVAAVITLSSINDDPSQVVRLVNSTIYDALKLQASDIHLECDAGCLHVQYRIDGVLVPITQVQGQHIAEQIVSRIKVMSELDIAERRVPQDGRFKVRVNAREIDFRVSIMPNIFGEDAVLRLLDRQSLTEQAKSLRLDNLGLDAHSIAAIRRLAAKPHGMLLVTGPTGSGKTTTLYAALTEIHTGRDKIITIEDPVEYRLPRVLQIPVNEKKGLTFARGLRSILRHDPDKIMVGEIRDGETAQIAVQAALTGHLVFTSVHANNVFDVVGRFLHMGVDAYSFAAALNGIVAQRLLRMNCPHCSVEVEPDQIEIREAGLTQDQVSGWTFKAGKGCGSCRGTGYKGRKAVAEVLLINDALREMIAGQASISIMKEQAAKAGLRPLVSTALEWVARGETTLAEVSRVAG